jgi:hypothetical protein
MVMLFGVVGGYQHFGGTYQLQTGISFVTII